MAKNAVHVAVGAIVNSQQQILLALRPDHVHQGGLWEFPGGKVEAGESVQQALVRELQEELAILPTSFSPLIEIHHDYADKSVFLDVWWVDEFTENGVRPYGSDPIDSLGQEGQLVRWVAASDLATYTFPEANTPIVEAVGRALARQRG